MSLPQLGGIRVKVSGDMAIFLVSHGMTVHEFEQLGADHTFTLPNSVVDMFMGSLGEPAGGWPAKIRKVILKGAKPQKGRPGARMKPADLEAAAAAVEKQIGHKPPHTDVLSYLMYPSVFLKFAKARQSYGDLEVLPTPQFFYGMQSGEEIALDLEAGKTLFVKYLTVSEPHPDATRTMFFELNGQPREVTVRDKTLKETVAAKPKADPLVAGQVGAPIPGAVTSFFVEVSEVVKKGDRLLVMEAMKMQTTVYAPVEGKIMQKLVAAGEQVEAKDLLVVIG
jgi:pyruvate carboxylase